MALNVTFVLTPPGVSIDDPYLLMPTLLPTTSAAATNRQTIETLLAGLPSRSQGQRATLLLPFGHWYVDRDINFHVKNVDVVGWGIDKTIIESLEEGAVFRVGCSPLAPATADHWVDLHGLLDSTAASSSGLRWGYDLKGDSHIGFGASGYSRGDDDGWGDTSSITVEIVFLGPLPEGPIFGGAWGNRPDPFLFATHPSSSVLFYTTDDGTLIQGTARNVALPYLGALAADQVHRFIFQFSMNGTAPPITAWLEGSQVTTPANPSTLGFSLPATFRRSNYRPLRIGAAGSNLVSYSFDTFSANVLLPMKILGLRVSYGLRYADDGPGTPLRRLDGLTVTDLRTFFTVDDSTAFLLPCDEGPDDSAATRRVPILSATGRSGGMLLDDSHLDITAGTTGVSIRDLTLKTPTAAGDALGVGFALSLTVRRVYLCGGNYGRGFGAWPWGPDYPLVLEDCIASGSVPVFLHQAIARIRDLRPTASGRVPVWNEGGLLDLDGLIFSFGTPEAIYVGSKGANATLRELVIDIETNDSPTIAPFVIENSTTFNGGADPGSLVLDGFSGGGMLAGTAIILALDGGAGSTYPGSIQVRGRFTTHSAHAAMVNAVAAGAWVGTINVRPPWAGYVAAVGAGAALIRDL